MIYSSKWRNIFRGVSTFQLILCFILFHSLASILIIYSHLSRYFSNDKIWKQTSENTKSLEDYIVWNLYTARNVLSSRIISNDEISVKGWWMDHVKYDNEIRCFKNLKWALCSNSFSTVCKIDGIRAVYQYVTFSKDSNVNGFDLHITATADQLESQATAATFGVVALVKLYDGSTENVQLQFPSNIEPLTSQSVSFSSSRSFICSVTLMLMCYGYSGSVHFTDPVLIPHGNLDLVSECPYQCPKPLSSGDKFRLEDLQKPTNNSFEDTHLVTLVTQVSMDRLSALERSLKSWFGPVSLVIYASSKHTEKSEYEWQRLYVQKKIKTLKLALSSHVTLALGTSVDGNYPINALRNIAMSQVRTRYMFLLDGDFEPAPDFQQKFSSSVKYFEHNLKIAFVVPAFEYIELPQKSDNAPQTKEELLQLLHREEPFILPFRISESSESHRNTDYWKWYRAAKPYILKSYCDKYEPYIVLQKSTGVPEYNENFFGYGMNKVMHITELYAANYTFVVLPDVWVLHLPHKVSTYAVEFLQNFHQRLKNRMERFEFIVDLMHSYKIKPCK